MNHIQQPKHTNSAKIGLFKLIFLICSGTTIFKKLVYYRYTRAVSHLVLISFICTLLIVLAHIFPAYSKAKRICNYLDRTYGNLNITKQGIYPSKKVLHKKELLFKLMAINAGITYYPEIKKEYIDDFMNSPALFNILWIPPLIIHCIKHQDNQYYIYPLTDNIFDLSLTSRVDESNFCNKEKLLTVLKSLKPFSMPESEIGSFPFKSYINQLTFFLLLPVFIINFLQIPLTALLYTIMVAVFYNFINTIIASNQFKALPLAQVITVATYSCIPAIIIASMLEALSITLMRFQQTFLFCFLAYFLIIITMLERDRLNNQRKTIRNQYK